MGKLENDNILQTHFRERKKVSKDEDSFDSDLNQSFKDGTPEVFILKIIVQQQSLGHPVPKRIQHTMLPVVLTLSLFKIYYLQISSRKGRGWQCVGIINIHVVLHMRSERKSELFSFNVTTVRLSKIVAICLISAGKFSYSF